MSYARSDRCVDAIYDAVEKAIDSGVDAREFVRIVAQAYEETHRERGRLAAKELAPCGF